MSVLTVKMERTKKFEVVPRQILFAILAVLPATALFPWFKNYFICLA
jgi:hypothetical protein